MASYRQIAVIEEGRLVLSGLPFPSGTKVEVNIEEDYVPKTELGREFASLLARMDESSGERAISPEEIAAEIAAYRAGR